jgi:hypothetical protein
MSNFSQNLKAQLAAKKAGVPYVPVVGFRAEQAAARAEFQLAQPQMKTYKNAKEFQKDAPRMTALGFTVGGQSQGGSRLSITRMATLGVFALAAPKKGKITVTWMPPVAV